MILRNSCCAIILMIATTLTAQTAIQINEEAFKKIFYQHTNDDSPGVAVGIVKNGTIVYEQYVGYANMEHKIKVAQDTRFNIASNAKQFTALCILKLEAEGKLRLLDDIRKYLPQLYKKVEEKITIAQLINHTSGVRDVYDLWSLKGQTWWQLFLTNEDALQLLEKQETLNFKPGTEYLYSNSNYILLTEIIEKVTETDFAQYAKTMFDSLNMNNTEFLTNYMEVMPNKARPYGNWNGWKEYPALSGIHGDGGLFTTLQDQLQWEMIIQQNDNAYLSEKLVAESQKPINKSSITTYGYGLMFGEHKGEKYAYHDGNTGAYNATLLRFPAHQMAIAVMSNNSNVPTNYMAKQLADEVLNLQSETIKYPSKPEKTYKKLQLSDVAGTYMRSNNDGSIIQLTIKNDTLYREMYQRDPIRLIQEKGSVFHYATNEDLKMAFEKQGSEIKSFTIFIASQAPITYEKLPSVFMDTSYKKHLNGTYTNGETETSIEIVHQGANEFQIVMNGNTQKAALLYKDILRMNSYEIKVVRNKRNEIVGLRLKGGRIKNVFFKKE